MDIEQERWGFAGSGGIALNDILDKLSKGKVVFFFRGETPSTFDNSEKLRPRKLDVL